MAFVQTQTQTAKGPMSEVASRFLTITGDDSKKGKSEKDQVFILNSKDFIDLQAYLTAGTNCAATNSLFESEYPRRAFAQYLKVDNTLYDGLRDQIVLTHGHCERFQGKVVGPMITTGGLVGNFGDFAKDEIEKILEYMDTLLDPNVSSKDKSFDTAKARIRVSCRKIASRAKTIVENCNDLVEDLGAFRSETESDKSSFNKLHERFKKAMPTEEQQDSALKKLLDKIANLLKKMIADAEKAVKEFQKQGQTRWYHYFPLVGLPIYIHDIVKQKDLLKMIKDTEAEFRAEKEKGKADIASMAKAHTLINALGDQIDTILETVDGAIQAVNEMSSGFSLLSTNFTEVRSYLGDVEGDIDEEALDERGLAKDDLSSAQAIWAKVAYLGKDFQLHGQLLKTDPEKPPPDTRQFSFPLDEKEVSILLSS